MIESAVVISGVLGNLGVVSVAGVLFTRWMDRKDKEDEQIRRDLTTAATQLAADLKATIAERRTEMHTLSEDMNNNLRAIYEQLKIANGRTGKLEGNLEAVKAVCAERHRHEAL